LNATGNSGTLAWPVEVQTRVGKQNDNRSRKEPGSAGGSSAAAPPVPPRKGCAMKCRICGNEQGHAVYAVREMMFGYPDRFPYFQCPQCGCLQIAEIPPAMARYYPDTYYSFQNPPARSRIVKFLLRQRDQYALSGRGSLGKRLYARYPRLDLRCLRELSVGADTRILDVGCGTGSLLCLLSALGLKHLLGIDPYNAREIADEAGFQILKREIGEVAGEWDIVMFHHSFEHVADPARTLRAVHEVLSAAGCCIIRIPLSSSYAWQHYGVDWVQLDAPRHVFLHSVESMQLLAAQAGFTVDRVVHDSTAFQFWGSEQYRAGIPLTDPRSYAGNPKASMFSKKDLAGFAKRAEELNQARQGDQAAFYLRKAGAADRRPRDGTRWRAT
jgi:SAM-dependent methyltransferase